MKINGLQGLVMAGATGLLALILANSASGQVLPGKRAAKAPAQPAAPAAPATPRDARDAANDAKRDARDAANDPRREVRDAPADARREAREDAREARQEAREDLRDARRDVRDINRATRAADLGVWFNTRAAGAVANGLVIADLATRGAFATAGFREGDRIVSVNGQPITTEAQFVQFLTAPNTQQISVVVVRDGQQQTIVLQPTALMQGVVNYDPLYQYGLIIDDGSPNRIVVQRVFPRTPAYYAGLRAGDVITTLAGQPINSLQTLTTALQRSGDSVALQVTRGGQARSLELDTSAHDSVRTALRPNFDEPGQLDGQGRTGIQPNANTPASPAPGATSPGAAAPGAPRPATPAPPAATPTQPVPPGTPTSPAPPRAPANPSGAPAAAPGAPAPAPGAPAPAPAAPRAPTAPGGPRPEAGGTGGAEPKGT